MKSYTVPAVMVLCLLFACKKEEPHSSTKPGTSLPKDSAAMATDTVFTYRGTRETVYDGNCGVTHKRDSVRSGTVIFHHNGDITINQIEAFSIPFDTFTYTFQKNGAGVYTQCRRGDQGYFRADTAFIFSLSGDTVFYQRGDIEVWGQHILLGMVIR